MEAFWFVLVTIGIPIAVYVGGTRQESFDDKTGAFIAVGLWFGLSWLMGWGADLISDRPVPYADEATRHAHSFEEFGLVVLWVYLGGFGLLKTAIAVGVGLAIGVLTSRKHGTS